MDVNHESIEKSKKYDVIIKTNFLGLGMLLSWLCACPACRKCWIQSLTPRQQGVMIHAWDPSSQRGEAGGSEMERQLYRTASLRAAWFT